ncbi:hypothetical protein KHA90_22535 [Flavobacterium psychroterrae]|uniref:Uncharacterized protein n=1 Tax=Flavobacterium psychroterrae TaxID=2133767 RepID=A0ABS5PHN7_9FLAO|nr:hypothetical protein [Flavobacterium psychroterrae]MBS7233799.1 hypothetical protein [Flavobacterium psychroterrae]
MALSNIDVRIIGDYHYCDEGYHDFHDNKIEDFKYYFKDWLEKLGRIPQWTSVNININYYPDTGRFEFKYISTKQVDILESLKNDSGFSSRYFTKLSV